MLNSEAGSVKSILSRMSKASARVSVAGKANAETDGALAKIEEQEVLTCEVCKIDIVEDEDILMIQEISK